MTILRNIFIGVLGAACIGCVVVEETGPVVVREPGPVVVQERYAEPVTHVHYFRFKPRHHHGHDQQAVVVVPKDSMTHQSQGQSGGGTRQVVVTPAGPAVQQNRGRSAAPAAVQQSQGSTVIESSGTHQSQGVSAPAVRVQ